MFAPVTVVGEQTPPQSAWSDIASVASGRIEIEIAGTRMTVIGSVAPELAQAIVAALRGRLVIGLSPNSMKIMVATQPVDFRRDMNGLVALVVSALSADPYCGDVFVFRAKKRQV